MDIGLMFERGRIGIDLTGPVIFIGFDSAWADNPQAPGAICAAIFDGNSFVDFKPPELVRFGDALAYINPHSPDSALISGVRAAIHL
jgi:hypothetical protein